MSEGLPRRQLAILICRIWLRAGRPAILRKPFDINALGAAVESALDTGECTRPVLSNA
jgi:hypothetical protein